MYAGEVHADAVTDDFAIHEPESLPYGGMHRGADAGMRLFEQICTFWKDAAFDVEDITVSERHAIVLITLGITAPETGERLTMRVCEVIELAGDKIRGVTVCHFDTAAMAIAAGLLKSA
jgi:ketosteroid isomerase-like protein